MKPSTTDQVAAHAALTQLCGTALTAARRAQRDRAGLIVRVLRGHGPDGVHACLTFMADVIIAIARADQGLSEGAEIEAARAEWIDPSTGQPGDATDPLTRWCGDYLIARARRDALACTQLVTRAAYVDMAGRAPSPRRMPDPGQLLRAMAHLTFMAATTVNHTTGAPQ